MFNNRKLNHNYVVGKKNKLTQEKREYTEPYPNTIMYRSMCGDDENLNGDARFESGDIIWCRHLSAFLVHELGKIKYYHNSYSTIQNIQSVPSFKTSELDEGSQKKSSVENYIFAFDKLGLILAKVANALLYDEERSYMMFSLNHAMAISIQKKRDPSRDESYYVVKFYDPNKTNSHARLVANDTQDLKKIKLNDFLSASYMQAYFRSFKSGLLMYSNKPEDKIRLFNMGMSPIELLGDDIQETAFFLAQYDFKEELNQLFKSNLDNLIQNIIESECIIRTKKHTGSLVNPEEHSCSLLIFLCEITRAEYLSEIIKGIINSNLNDNAKLNFLKGTTDPNENCVLSKLLSRNDYSIIETYIESVFNSSLTIDIKYELFNTSSESDGHSGFLYAICFADIKIVKLYIEKILSSNFDNKLKARLLSPKRFNDGVSPLNLASARKCRGEIVKLYIQSILGSALNDEIKIELLLAERKDGITGLLIPFQNGYSEIIMHYVTNILSSKLSPKDKILLLSPVNPHTNQTGLDLAMAKGNLDTVQKFTEAILDSGLPTADIMKLLTLNVFKNTKDDCAQKYNDLIEMSELTQSEKEHLTIKLKQKIEFSNISFQGLKDNPRQKAKKRKREDEKGAVSRFFDKFYIKEMKGSCSPIKVSSNTLKI